MKSFTRYILVVLGVIVLLVVSNLFNTYILDGDGRGALDRASQLNNGNKPEEAIAIALPAIDKWERRIASDGKSIGIVEVMPFLGLLKLASESYEKKSDIEGAVRLLERHVRISEGYLTADEPGVAELARNELARTLVPLAKLDARLHRYDAALAALVRARSLRKNYDAAIVATAEIYMEQGRYIESEKELLALLDYAEKTYGGRSRAVADALEPLAKLYEKQGRKQEWESASSRYNAIMFSTMGAGMKPSK